MGLDALKRAPRDGRRADHGIVLMARLLVAPGYPMISIRWHQHGAQYGTQHGTQHGAQHGAQYGNGGRIGGRIG